MRFFRARSRGIVATMLAIAQVAGMVVVWVAAIQAPAFALTCATPGKDGAGGSLSGIVNTYYEGTASAAAGATSIHVSGPLANGAATAIAAGDMLLVIQNIGATINSSNNSNYGAGTGTGTGYTALNSAGKYEYVKAASAVAAGVVTIVGAGGGGGLVNSYTYSAAQATPALFQVIRVPQYTTATLTSTLAGGAWENWLGGGGVIVIDVDSTLTLGGTVDMSGQGFMGGDLTTKDNASTDEYVFSSTTNNTAQDGYGYKGEGIAGSPQFLRAYSTAGALGAAHNGGSDFIPVGGAGRGAPANAGGGGSQTATTDGGGAGGGNGGAGGLGGSNGVVQGIGASALSPSATFISFGGGGGSGATFSGTSPTNGEGASGGGMILIRAKAVAGAGTIQANGVTGQPGTNAVVDGGGGGGGGTVMVTTTTGNLTGLTANANGGTGGADSVAGRPGGGGGGGAVLLSAAATSMAVAAGPAGAGGGGSAAGGAGVTNTTITPSSIPGASSGAECLTPASFTGFGPMTADTAVGSYDGVVAVNKNDDFTAVSFTPAAANFTNSSTTAGSPTGNALGGPTTVNVPNELDYTAAAVGSTLTLTGTAPAAPAGWTMRICPDNAGAPSCATTAVWTTVGAASAAPTSVLTLTSLQALSSYRFWAVYSAPSGVVAFTRYDAVINATDGTNTNDTHNELYPGFIPLTKTVTVSSTGCPSGVSPPAGGACPGGLLLYTIDYRNIAAGGNAAGSTEPLSAFPTTAAGTLVITENGAAGGNNWGADSGGLHEVLVPSANGTTTFGDSTASSTFTGNSVGSGSFTCTVGGASFQLVPQGMTGVNKGWQGTITYRVVIL